MGDICEQTIVCEKLFDLLFIETLLTYVNCHINVRKLMIWKKHIRYHNCAQLIKHTGNYSYFTAKLHAIRCQNAVWMTLINP